MSHNSFFQKYNLIGVYYSLTILVVVSAILLEAKIFHIQDPTWALISGVVCTEFESESAKSLILLRILSTIFGAGIAALILYVAGINYISLSVGTLLISLLCHYLKPLKNSWKLATATGIIVLIAGLQQHSLIIAESIAFKRALEVIAGSLTAGVISFICGIFKK